MRGVVILTLDEVGDISMSVLAEAVTDGEVELVVLAEPDPDHDLLEKMIAALDQREALVCTRPVSEAVKVVRGGFVHHGLDRRFLITLHPPYVIRRQALAGLQLTSVPDLLALLVDRGGVGLFPPDQPET